MQVKTNIYITGWIGLLILLFLFVTVQKGKAQSQDCRDSLNEITQAYHDGQWDFTREQSRRFLQRYGNLKYNFFDDYWSKTSGDCTSYLPQVYYYLIRSCLRLYYLDSAKWYYADALKRDIVVDLDTVSGLKNYFKVKRRQYAIGVYFGTNMLANTYKFNYKAGLQYGLHKAFKLEAFVDLSYSERVFAHESSRESGPFGHAIEYSPNQFPQYHFDIEGKERFLDLAYIATLPFDLSLLLKSNRVKGYLIGGPDLSYYINSSVNKYTIQKNTSASDFVVFRSTSRSRTVDALGMDLTKLYTKRFGAGFIAGIGTKVKLSKEWVFFTELRYTLGTNFKYRYSEFTDFRPGTSYLTVLVGLRRSRTFLKPKSFLENL